MTIHKAAPVHRIHRVTHGAAELQPESSPIVQTVVHSPSARQHRATESDDAFPIAMAAARGPSLGDYVELPFRYWRLLACCLATSIVAGLLALIVWPRSYESEAKLMITVGRESVGLDPTATTSPTLMLQKTQEEEINSALEILSSRQVAELVVDKLSATQILDGVLSAKEESQPSSTGWIAQAKQAVGAARNMLDQGLLSVGVKDPVSQREQAIRKVMQSVYIYAPKRSTAITIHAESKTPEMAQALAAAVTYGFLDRHQSVNFNQSSREFFQEQTREVEAQVNQARAERAEFMQLSKVVSIEDQRRILTDQMGSAQRDVLITRGELEQAQAEIKDLTGKADETLAEIVANKEEKGDETWSGMRQRVYELEIQEQSYASMYSEDNPKLLNARQQLEGARQILKDMEKDRTNRSLTPNPVKIRMEEDLQRLQTRLVGLRSMLLEKEKQREELGQQIDELLGFELKLNGMDRNIAVLENSLYSLKSKLEEARVIDELQAQHISNISIYQPATLVERPVNPQKSMVMAAFPVLGLMIGLGVALLFELGNKALRSERHVEQCLGRQVLASFPFQVNFQGVTAGDHGNRLLFSTSGCQAILAEAMMNTSGENVNRATTIGVLGIDVHCGTSTLAASLAHVGSHDLRLRTLLIDGNPPAATTSSAKSSRFNVESEGWSDDNLGLVKVTENQHRCLLRFDGGEQSPLLSEYQTEHDLIIIDLPPASRPGSLNRIAQHIDYILLVIESEKSDAPTVARLVRRLDASHVAVGVVLNKTRSPTPRILSGFVG